MPSPLKRPSLGRLLAALRSPPRVPVQTGFPTALADLVVKNHARLRKPRKPRRPTTALALPQSPAETPVDVAEIPSLPSSPGPLSPVVVEGSSAPVARRLDAPKGAAFFRPRPELLALGGAVALALLAVLSEGAVAAFTIASLALLWMESASRRRRRSSRPAELPDSRGPAAVSPIREVEEAPGCSDSDKRSEGPSERRELVSGGEDPASPKSKARRSLRKMISKTLQKKPKAKDASASSEGGAEAVRTEAFVIPAPSLAEQTPSEASTESSPVSVETERRGLAAGKLPATALAVLCVAFFGRRRAANLG
ncbi:hypothetical protein CFC21_069605 [Triticum aestivum]|uniref:Uncharacterized protein n=3 Tax=Triticum TaxID=4564 RepID=A0A9R1AG35_TRITD|nr:uncharacterized protein LOC123115465 [Triticum aestivum]KAF7063074.1 hypothetical protein CFC21_069605 [Triticum aestivum]VAI26620.1 unnamed protein product [Triticum turgidum subsp. durum]